MSKPDGPCLNLILDPWLPAIRRSGRRQWIAPTQLTEGLQTDPVMRLGWNRPDLDTAAHEFLIGLLSSATPPPDERHWIEWEREPPTERELAGALEPLAGRFDLAGETVRFGQDREPYEQPAEPPAPERRPVERLLLDAPGDAALRKGTDFFVRGRKDAVLSLPAAAIALHAHHQFAGSGGGGYRTALRGGGPWVVRVLGRQEEPPRPLWHEVWGNTETREQQAQRGADRREGGSRFPWEAATRVSDDRKAPAIVQADVHPQIVYWATPRRIRLSFDRSKGRRCALTGREDTWVVNGFYALRYGANYDSGGFRHPLTPYYRKSGKPKVALPMHPQPAGLTLRSWAQICSRAYPETHLPPAVLETWRERVRKSPAPVILRVRLAGFDLDSAKCRAWIAASAPAVAFASAGAEAAFNEAVLGYVEGIRMVASQLARSIERARIGEPLQKEDKRQRRAAYEALTQQLNRAAMPVFYAQLPALVRAPRKRAQSAVAMLNRLAGEAIAIFERESAWQASADLQHYARAWRSLRRLLSGKGGDGQSLYRQLGAPEPDPEAGKNMTSAPAWRDPQAHADAKACLRWWGEANKRGNRKGLQAMHDLARARSLASIETHAAALRLVSACPGQPRDPLLIAAGVLAAARVNRPTMRVARQIGQAGLNAPPRGALPPQALRALLTTHRSRLLAPLRELVRAAKGRINVLDLAYLILTWDRTETRRRFLYDYYGVGSMRIRPADYAPEGQTASGGMELSKENAAHV